MPMLNLWRANISWNSTKSDSILLLSCCCSIESLQSKLLKILRRDSSSSFGFSFSASCKLRNSLSIHCCMGVRDVSSPGISGVGNQYCSYWSLFRFAFRRLLMFWIASSSFSFIKCHVDTGSIGLTCFICSRVNTEKFAICNHFLSL